MIIISSYNDLLNKLKQKVLDEQICETILYLGVGGTS